MMLLYLAANTFFSGERMESQLAFSLFFVDSQRQLPTTQKHFFPRGIFPQSKPIPTYVAGKMCRRCGSWTFPENISSTLMQLFDLSSAGHYIKTRGLYFPVQSRLMIVNYPSN